MPPKSGATNTALSVRHHTRQAITTAIVLLYEIKLLDETDWRFVTYDFYKQINFFSTRQKLR